MSAKNAKKVRKVSQLADAPVTQPPVASASGGLAANNSQHGFIRLPSELQLMILSYFPTIPDAEMLRKRKHIQSYEDGPNYLGRFRVLLALSQTCRALRAYYLPLCWERVQSCIVSGADRIWYHDLGRGIEIQSEGLIKKSPHLRPLVKIVTVSLSRFQADRILPPFAELLTCLPNLHTIQVIHSHTSLGTKMKTLFEGKVFPSVRSVILPNCARDILRCCPGVREVTCNEHDGGRLITALADGKCNQVEVLRGISPTAFIMKRLLKLNPPLRCIRIGSSEDLVRRFSKFPSLRVIEINVPDIFERVSWTTGVVEAAKETLRACSTYKPPPKGGSALAVQEAEEARVRLTTMYPEPAVVRVRRLPGHAPALLWGRDCPYFYPRKIEEHPA